MGAGLGVKKVRASLEAKQCGCPVRWRTCRKQLDQVLDKQSKRDQSWSSTELPTCIA